MAKEEFAYLTVAPDPNLALLFQDVYKHVIGSNTQN